MTIIGAARSGRAGQTRQPIAEGLEPQYGVLGPLAIWRGQRPIEIPAAKHRMLLSVLLASANRPVSMDCLVDELWAVDPPDTARKTVQGYVWRLRRTIGCSPDDLTTVGSGYRLGVPAARLDVLEFERLVASANRALSAGHRYDAAEKLTAGLRIWRGPAFDNVPEAPTVRAYAIRLNEARLAAHELLASVQCEFGRYGDVVPELTGLAAANPYRESMHRLLMSALNQAGRPLEALNVYARFRRRLAENFGLDPHHETTRLHDEILRAPEEGRRVR